MKTHYLLTPLLAAAAMASAQESVIINEFMALNSKTIADKDGKYSDWIELYNAGEQSVSLEGWYLTDDENDLRKWRIPAVNIAAEKYLLIFASGNDYSDPASELHTNFKLSGAGEYLALVKADGTTVAYEYAPTYPDQQTDQSYGVYLSQHTYFSEPTPGAPNSIGSQVLSPVFGTKGGFCDYEFDLTLSVADASTSIYYTLDGTRPDKKNATLYTAPIHISTTTPVSAVCISPDGTAGGIVTQTYLYLADILQQPAKVEGYPQQWSYMSETTFTPSDYEMDAKVCESQEYKPMMYDAMTDIPSMCIVTNPDYLFSHEENETTGGIYIYTGKGAKGSIGDGWERPASVEYYDPQSGKSFQINCGLLLHGGNSRNPGNSPKHSFRISFREKYGASKLNFKIFEDKDAASRFDHLVLRAGYNYTWIKNGSATLYPGNIIQRENAQYIIDDFAKQTQFEMGHTATHARFIHLYINGLYWGLYDISEKINNDFAESYLGGDDDDYDVLGDHAEIIDGNDIAYKKMYALATGVGTSASDSKYQQLISDNLLDMENYIDYMLINFYIGNDDWDSNNWRVMRNRIKGDQGFKYLVWDAEAALTDVNINKVTYKKGDPTVLLAALKKNPEFKLLFADRIQKHFFNSGVLSPENTAARYQMLAQNIDLAIIGESARWGDYRQTITNEATEYYTRRHWLERKSDLLTNYFPARTDIVFNQLKEASLYPSIDAPAFSHNSGTYCEAFKLTLNSSKGNIYYTTDGSDPRTSITGAVNASASKFASAVSIGDETTIKARTLSGSTWSALAQASYKIDANTGIDDTESQYVKIFFADSRLNYTLEQDARVSITIYRSNGSVAAYLGAAEMQQGEHSTPLLELEAGTYLYNVKIDGKSYSGKFAASARSNE